MIDYKINDIVYLNQGNTMGKTENILLKVINILDDNKIFTECITNKAYGQKHTRIQKDFLKGMQYTFCFDSGLIPCSESNFNNNKFEIFVSDDGDFPTKYENITSVMQVKAQKKFSWQGNDFFVYKDYVFEYLTGLCCGPFFKNLLDDESFLNSIVNKFEKFCNMCTLTKNEISETINIEAKNGNILNKTNEGNKKVRYTERAKICGFNFVLIKSPKHGHYVVIEQYTGVSAHEGDKYDTKENVWSNAIKKIKYNKDKIPAILNQFEKIN